MAQVLDWEVSVEIDKGVEESRDAIARFLESVPGSDCLLALIGHGIEV